MIKTDFTLPEMEDRGKIYQRPEYEFSFFKKIRKIHQADWVTKEGVTIYGTGIQLTLNLSVLLYLGGCSGAIMN